MALRDISDPAALDRAVAEYDALGEEAFLEKYGFLQSRLYWADIPTGKLGRYASKAILAAAHGYQFPHLGPLKASDFGGGRPTIGKLREFGVQLAPDASEPQNPDWLRDEIILALDVYMRHREQLPGKHSAEIANLSELLRQMHAALGTRGKDTLRNANGVYMKLMNLRGLDPLVVAQGRSGLSRRNRLEEEVWAEFGDDPARLGRVAQAIAAQVKAMGLGDGAAYGLDAPDDGADEYEAAEGRILGRMHYSRERNRSLVDRKKRDAMKRHGRLTCEACAFDFKARYGERGADFIECHHTRPLETLGDGGTTKASDLALLCANCHRMIHAKRPWLSVAELRALIT